MPFFDPTYILVIIGAIIVSIASSNVNSTFKKYAQDYSVLHLTAAEAARKILDSNGLNHIRIERVSGELTDHYDPRADVIRLSDSTFSSTSVAAIGVAAHEAGHAIQHANNYIPIKMRNVLIPVANIGSTLSFPLLLIGIIFSFPFLVNLGIYLFAGVLLFQIVTLPVELNASNRAIVAIENGGLLNAEETKKARKVLNAAAMTYVAAVGATALQLLRLLLLSRNRRD